MACDSVTIWLSEHGGKHGSMAWKDLGKLCELDGAAASALSM